MLQTKQQLITLRKIKTRTWKAIRSILETAARRSFGLKQ
jgi:hypothetical protein